MRRNLRNSIIRSIGRYIAIAAIIALGAGIFVGLLMTKTDMVSTGQMYMDDLNMFDIRLVSTYGWGEEQAVEAAKLEGIEHAEGVFYTDLVARIQDEPEEKVYRFYTLPEQLNKVALESGRMPQTIGECLIDGYHGDGSLLGKDVLLSAGNDEDSLADMKVYRFTIMGYIASPLYMDMNRGTTSVGNGSLEKYIYIPRDSVNADYYTEIHLTLPGYHEVYSDSYNTLMEDTMDAIEPAAEQLGQDRFAAIKAEAEEEYQDGYQEYLDGVEEYEEGKAEAEQELADALQELTDGEQEIKDTYKDLQNAEHKLAKAKSQITDALSQVRSGKSQISSAIAQLEPQKPALESGKAQLEASFGSLSSIIAAPGKLDSVNQKISQVQQELAATDPADSEKISSLQAELTSLSGQQAQLTVMSQYADQASQIQSGLAALNQLYAQKKELDSNEKMLEENLDTVKWNITKVYNGYEDLEEAKLDIEEGWEEYYEGKAEAEQELADAAEELADAKADLAEAREDIDSMEEPDVIILDRNSNVGYNNLDSASSIVQGVARVLPVFFLLIAALVCITTMTRMIEEERTQIGTLKALGYSNRAIIGKYLAYAGSSAVLGSGLGIAAGCTLFPVVIWEAYKLMLHITGDIVLTIDWPLAITVVGVYTAVIMGVTWYCCHKTLEEVPAELIRPKAPEAGKALFVERLPFWGKIGFLNKVTIRNIFRYRQRLAMMLVGIGGCTALLVTGFGLRDSITNVVDFQFKEVALYDLQVYFRDDLDQEAMDSFVEELDPSMEHLFYHQSSVELEHDNRMKELYMMAVGEEVTSFLRFHRGGETVSVPGVDEVVLSVGVAENLGIRVGDRVTMRNSDMEELTVTVSGIYDNHVDNYAVVLPETIEKQWNRIPGKQMALVTVPDNDTDDTISARLSDLDTVMNVSVSADQAGMVGSMMEALDYVIILIVACAGLLAVTVLYNLINININERIREIATIKVLGFNASETAAYVFKENMVLTVAGSIFGLGLGYLLLVFVISQVKIDMVWFKPMVMTMSYVYSIALTLLSAVVVNFIFYFKLQKINMAEALKSVE